MKKYNSHALLTAFDNFLEEDKELASKAGYEITTSNDLDGETLYMDISTEYDDLLPTLSVDVNKREDDTYDFIVKVSFPELRLNSHDDLKDYLGTWEPVADLVDDLTSIQFNPIYWIN